MIVYYQNSTYQSHFFYAIFLHDKNAQAKIYLQAFLFFQRIVRSIF